MVAAGLLVLASLGRPADVRAQTPGPCDTPPGCTIWLPSQAPGNASVNDPSQVELGVRFRTATAGYITAIRFYKGPSNTGTHVAHLWTSSGTLLSSVTFAGESASGWQEVALLTPVPVAADTTYVASYHTNTGFYSADNDYFTGAATTNGPLQALQDGVDGGNGLYGYGSGSFPTGSFRGTNYWVDVVFMTSLPPDTMPPTVVSMTPTGLASSNAVISAGFSEDMNPATISPATFEVRDASSTPIAGSVAYSAATRSATFQPAAALLVSTTYTVVLRGGAGGMQDVAGNALAADVSWTFTSAGPPPTEGPGGPILVVRSSANQFSSYYAEILRAEGLNAFAAKDINDVTATLLSSYDVVVLGEMPLTAAQVTMFGDWVNAGGNLIAMRPDKQLALLLGLTDAGSTLQDAYLQVDTSSAPGNGIVGTTMQFHGTADRYTLSGAAAVASLFNTATTGTTNPAVTVRSVGAAGGHAAAFTYDLARSVVYTRQGNPAWSGQERDGLAPIRSDDLFFGGAQANYVDLSKVAIPQADEQQRLLANVVGFLNAARRPLPRFWYLPRGLKAAVVMTGDDHANNGTQGRFDIYKSNSAPGCSVADWQCVRATSYIFPSTPISNAAVAGYVADGFEIGAHMWMSGLTSGSATASMDCHDFTPASADADYSLQLAAVAARFPGTGPVRTNRTHCIVWSDYDTQPQVAFSHGIRLDTNYYYWPASWIQNVPGLFTGSGFPQRFAKADGTMLDIYQATTQMTDESGQVFPFNVDTLLARALGPEGYYGTFVANMHTDTAVHDGSVAIVASAQARGVPIISAAQLLDWTDGRNTSSFSNILWGGGTLSFSVSRGAHTNGLQAMIPASSTAGPLAEVLLNGAPVAYTSATIKGVAYAFITVADGSYEAHYHPDTTPPVLSAIAVTAQPSSAVVTWQSNEPATSRVDYGPSPTSLVFSATAPGLSGDHAVTLTGLASNTVYYFRVTSIDAAGNSASAPSSPGTFTTAGIPPLSIVDTTSANFLAGTVGTGAYVSQIADGEVMLAPIGGTEFDGTTLPAGATSTPWSAGGTSVVGGGRLVVDGARLSSDTLVPPGVSLEFGTTFATDAFQHIGFGLTLTETPWAIFSTGSGGALYARTNNGTLSTDTLIPGSWLGSPHRFRIDWTSSSVIYRIDGVQVASHPIAISASMRILVSDATPGAGTISMDWLHVLPYATSATFTSRVLDANSVTLWSKASWVATVPSGSSLAVAVRFGNTATPDGSWTGFVTVPASGGALSQSSRFVQYRLTMTGNGSDTPIVESFSLTAGAPAPSISVSDVSKVEGNSGTSNAVFTLTLSSPMGTPVSVNYATAAETATAGADYITTSGTATFPAGTTSVTVAVPVVGDTAIEPSETFVLNLSTPVNAYLADAQARGTIVDDDGPKLSIAPVTVTEGNTGSVGAIFTVSLSGPSPLTITVGYATANGTATAGADYTATSGTLTFPAGTTTQTISVPVLGDTLDEPTETFVVNLSGATNATIATAQATGTIVDNDLPALSINNVSVTEDSSKSVSATFTVTLSSASTSTVTVNYATANGTAVSGSDYNAASGQLSFPAGTTSRTLTVTVLGDSLDEATETFAVNLSAPVNATIADAQGIGTIVDSDTAPSLSINNVSVAEGNTGTVNATLTVTLSKASGQTVTVNYATANGTATSADYTSTSGTLTFAPGTTSRTITVAVRGDTLDEGNETINVNLSAATNASIGDSVGVITINDDDTTPSLSINNASVTEGNSGTKTMTFTVTLSAASGRTVTVNYATANGSASSSSDYVATSGTLTFAAGTTTQTITVTVRGDTTRESNETFAVNLSGASNATIADSQGTGTILNDD